jgi:hypothetical protein
MLSIEIRIDGSDTIYELSGHDIEKMTCRAAAALVRRLGVAAWGKVIVIDTEKESRDVYRVTGRPGHPVVRRVVGR